MKILSSYLPILFVTVILGLTSCKKKCILEEGVNAGDIIENVVIYPESGYMTTNMGGDYVIDATHPYADRFEVSFNNDARTAVNYSNYTILAYPLTSTCTASFDKTVTIDNAAQTVVYKIVVTQCLDCTESRTTENYVLVPAFPATYTVLYDVSYVDK